ncbi:TetR/AcrR family transcriptional regulator [Spirillospora sp. NPDC052269]
MNPDDPRVRRTRARLRTAILELATEHGLDAVTIAAVAKRAEINRATVYLHYPDVDALAVDAMNDAVAHVTRAAALCPLDAPRDQPPAPLLDLFERIGASRVIYAHLLGEQGSARFAARMRDRLTAALCERFTAGSRPAGFDDIPIETHAAYLAGALLGVITQWTTQEHLTPAPAAAADFWKLFRPPGGA